MVDVNTRRCYYIGDIVSLKTIEGIVLEGVIVDDIYTDGIKVKSIKGRKEYAYTYRELDSVIHGNIYDSNREYYERYHKGVIPRKLPAGVERVIDWFCISTVNNVLADLYALGTVMINADDFICEVNGDDENYIVSVQFISSGEKYTKTYKRDGKDFVVSRFREKLLGWQSMGIYIDKVTYTYSKGYLVDVKEKYEWKERDIIVNDYE